MYKTLCKVGLMGRFLHFFAKKRQTDVRGIIIRGQEVSDMLKVVDPSNHRRFSF
jgi:hypothetical protein